MLPLLKKKTLTFYSLWEKKAKPNLKYCILILK